MNAYIIGVRRMNKCKSLDLFTIYHELLKFGFYDFKKKKTLPPQKKEITSTTSTVLKSSNVAMLYGQDPHLGDLHCLPFLHFLYAQYIQYT